MTDPECTNPGRRLVFDSAAASHCGYVRSSNQDALLDAREQRLWVVADGMGGHSAGDKAAQTIVQTLAEFRPLATASASLESLRTHLKLANHRCREQQHGTTSGSTVVALYCHAHYGFVVWSGDSRLYRWRNQQLRKLTRDHNLAESLRQRNVDHRRVAQSSHILTHAVGIRDQLHMESLVTTVQAGDVYLLCSDGLYRSLSRRRLRELLHTTHCSETAHTMLAHSLRAGARDNVSVVVVRVGDAQDDAVINR